MGRPGVGLRRDRSDGDWEGCGLLLYWTDRFEVV
jgi:hypothetical protein